MTVKTWTKNFINGSRGERLSPTGLCTWCSRAFGRDELVVWVDDPTDMRPDDDQWVVHPHCLRGFKGRCRITEILDATAPLVEAYAAAQAALSAGQNEKLRQERDDQAVVMAGWMAELWGLVVQEVR